MKGYGNDDRYWAAMREGRLELPRCGQCQRWIWPAPFRCGTCGSWDIHWHEVEKAGLVYSWTRTWHPFAGGEDLGLPFVTVVVELPHVDGIRLYGLLEPGEDAVVGLPVTGSVKTSRVYDHDIPALRWSAAI